MASRYWVGGTADWDGTAGTKWALTSGAAGGQAIPTSSDDVFFDGASGEVTVTISSGNTDCKSITCTGFIGTLVQNSTISIYGSLILSTAMIINWSSGIMFFYNNSSLTSAGKTLGFPLYYNGPDGFTFDFNDDYYNPIQNIGPVAGLVRTNGHTITIGGIQTQATGSIDLGTSSVYITGGLQHGGSGTFSALLSKVIYNRPNSTAYIWADSPFSLGVVNLTLGYSTFTFNGSSRISINTFNIVADSSSYCNASVWLQNNSLTIVGTFSSVGTGLRPVKILTGQIFGSETIGTTASISAGGVSLNRAYFQDIIALGTASPWSGTLLGDMGGNSNINFTTGATQTWQGTLGGSWSNASKWTSRVPLPQDNVVISSAFSASQIISHDSPVMGKNISFVGSSGNVSLIQSQDDYSSARIFGSLVLSSGVSLGAPYTGFNFLGRTSSTLTTAGNIVSAAINLNMLGGSVTLLDNLNMDSNSLQHNLGTFDANGFNVTTLAYVTASGNKTLNMGSGTWNITSIGNYLWYVLSGTTINPGSSTILFSDTSSNTNIFTGGGKSYNNIHFYNGTGYQIADSNTFNLFYIDAPGVVKFAAGTTTTISNLIVNSSAGNLVTINSVTSGSAWNISKSSGLINVNYLSIKDSHASGGATFYAGNNSINVSGNTGWIFTGLPPTNFIGIGSVKGIGTLVI